MSTFQESGKPDPEFKEFFSGDYKEPSEWKKMHEAVQVPGMPHATWDRKAAYIVFCLLKTGELPKAAPEPEPQPVAAAAPPRVRLRTPPTLPPGTKVSVRQPTPPTGRVRVR